VHLADDVLPDVVREATQQLGNQQTDLRGPRRRVGPHREDAAVERLRLAVVRDLVAHELSPPPDDRADRDVLDPAEVTQQDGEGRGDELWIAAVAAWCTAWWIEW
jgi:hypothetical protein